MNTKYKHSVLVTGAAGFIGAALVKRLLASRQDQLIVGIDSLNDYYNPALKEYRLKQIYSVVNSIPGTKFEFIRGDICDEHLINDIFSKFCPDTVIHLAAQAGVRHSIEAPEEYIDNNIIGSFRILEACRHLKQERGSFGHLIFASSSSVYGAVSQENSELTAFKEDQTCDRPVSLYAATKKAVEEIAYSYSQMFGIPITGLRFFTVYGPAGRPDMAYYDFADKLSNGESINLYNQGKAYRDFTYIDDVTEGICRVVQGGPAHSIENHYAIYNLGHQEPIALTDFVKVLVEELKCAGVISPDLCIEDHIHLLPMQTGDVPVTFADCSAFRRDYGFAPQTDLRTGLRAFANWLMEYKTDGGQARKEGLTV